MRNTFIKELVRHARANDNIALIVGDLGFSVVEPFAEEFPDRFINAGVAEQNMTGIAAGMASEGYHVFTYSIANFPLFRCAEQIRNDIDYHNLPVTIVSVGGGLAYGNLGYSHHAVQDLALIRSMNNMLIASPRDPNETSFCLGYLIDNPQPSFFRLGKTGEINLKEKNKIVRDGQISYLIKNKSDILILSTGSILQSYLGLIENFTYEKSVSIGSIPLWKSKEYNELKQELSKYKFVFTVEEHIKDGGFGSYINDYYNVELKSFTLNKSVCGAVANQKTLIYDHLGSEEYLANDIRKTISGICGIK